MSHIWKTIPLFISSTFRDMHAERDQLNRVVFPAIEERLKPRRCRIAPIDLRVGVETDSTQTERERELQILKVCLAEIERSRPFLLVLLGDRYGWVPGEDRIQAAASEAGFRPDDHGGSVTALEIEYGLLRKDPNQRRRCLLYLREPLPYHQMPTDKAAIYSDAHAIDSGASDRVARLRKLKARINADSEITPHRQRYSLEWDKHGHHPTAVSVAAWGRKVENELWQLLDAETAKFAVQAEPTWEDEERFAIEEQVERLNGSFVGRQELVQRALELAQSPPAPDALTGLVFTGNSGTGKSALFARLHIELSQLPEILLLSHAAGVSPRSGQTEWMLRRWIGELGVILGKRPDLPETISPEDLGQLFAQLLRQAAQTRRVVVMVDALNQFIRTTRSRTVSWLPTVLPANARFIATTLPSDESMHLARNPRLALVNVPPLDSSETRAIAAQVYGRYHRTPNIEVLRELFALHKPDGAPAAGNPLWLTLALDLLNQLDADDFARAEECFTGSPAEKLRAQLLNTARRMPPDVPALYGSLLEQTEKTFGAPLARAFAAVIALGRVGWRETDLLALVPTAARLLFPKDRVPAFDDLALASIRRGFRAHLARRGTAGQLDFFHTQMREAVQIRALNDGTQVQAIHRAIADHLVSLPESDPLRETELMVHLIGGNDAEHAALMLANVDGDYSLPVVYGYAATTPVVQTVVRHISLGDEQKPNPNLQWIVTLLAQPNLSPDQIASMASRFCADLDVALANAADLQSRQILMESVNLALRALVANRPDNAEWQRLLSHALNKLGELAKMQGDLPSALHYFNESRTMGQQLAIRMAAGNDDPEDPAASLDKSRDVPGVQDQEDCGSALEEVYENFGKLNSVEAIQAHINEIEARRQQKEAEIKRLQAEIKLDELSEQAGLCSSLDSLGDIAMAQGDLTSALHHYNQSKVIREQIAASDPYYVQWRRDLTIPPNELSSNEWIPPERTEWQNNLAVSLDRLGGLAMRRGDLAEAARHFMEGHAILERIIARDPTNIQWRQSLWQSNLAESNRRLGDVAEAMGDLEEACRRYNAAKDIAERLAANDPSDVACQRRLALALANLGGIATAKADPTGALNCFTESHAIYERIAARDATNTQWQRDLCMAQDNLATLAHAQGNHPEALRLWTAAKETVRRLAASSPSDADCQRGLAVIQRKIGGALQAQGDGEGALNAYRESLTVASRLAAGDPSNAGWQCELSTSLERMGDMMLDQGDEAGAFEAHRESLTIRERLVAAGPSNVAWLEALVASLQRMAFLAVRAGKQREAAEYFAGCHSVLKQMQASGIHLDQQFVRGLGQLERASVDNYASLMGAAAVPVAAPSPLPIPVHIADPLARPRREISLEERRESANRCFQRELWEAAAGDFQRLLEAGEPLADCAPKLITCLLNAHETPLASDVKRIEDLLQKLEQASHSKLAAQLRHHLLAKLPRKKGWRFW